MTNQTEVDYRVADLIEHAKGFQSDCEARFLPRDHSNQALDGTKLRLEGQMVVDMIDSRTTDGAYFALALGDERTATKDIKGRLEDLKLDLLHDINSKSEAEYRASIESLQKHHYTVPPKSSADIDSTIHRLPQVMRNEAVHRLYEDLQAWHQVYQEIVTPARRQWPAVDEGFERLDQKWAGMLRDAQRELVVGGSEA